MSQTRKHKIETLIRAHKAIMDNPHDDYARYARASAYRWLIEVAKMAPESLQPLVSGYTGNDDDHAQHIEIITRTIHTMRDFDEDTPNYKNALEEYRRAYNWLISSGMHPFAIFEAAGCDLRSFSLKVHQPSEDAS